MCVLSDTSYYVRCVGVAYCTGALSFHCTDCSGVLHLLHQVHLTQLHMIIVELGSPIRHAK